MPFLPGPGPLLIPPRESVAAPVVVSTLRLLASTGVGR